MSEEITFGNPWHGRMTPGGLVLADATLKTTMDGTGPTGAPYIFNYYGQNYHDLAYTYYVKQPGLPTPVTPGALALMGGEFKNDAVFTGSIRRYSPFSTRGLGSNKWLHYGSDGVWRKLSLSYVTEGPVSHTMRIYRQGAFGHVGEDAYTENTLIAELTFTHTSPVPYSFASFPPLEARFDGRQIIVTRKDQWGGALDSVTSDGKWNNNTQPAIVAAWRVDIAADAGSASVTKIWEVADPDTTFTAEPADYSWPTGDIFYTGGPYSWRYWVPFARVSYGRYGETFRCKRLLGAAFGPDGELHLIEWDYAFDYPPIYWDITGTHYLGTSGGVDPVIPALPASYGTSSEYPSTSVKHDVKTYTITVKDNGVLKHTLSSSDPYPIFSAQLTNNVFDLRHAAGSLGRFAPGVADTAPSAVTPLYASFNPRTSTILTSATPVGFV